MTSPIVLVPTPQQLAFSDQPFFLPDTGLIAISATEPQQAWKTAVSLQTTLRSIGLQWEIVAGTAAIPAKTSYILLTVVPGSGQHPQGYDLTITPEGATLVAQTPAGLFYAVQTLRQLVQQRGRTLPTLRCTDWPDFPNRGVMLDISRNKVLTQQTLYELVDLFANWKINQLQLYTEHTFAYRQHLAVWANASPMTGEEILALDAYCRDRFIELVPNQNSFGHLRPWLIHQPYRHLAECPDGCDTVWGHFDEPFSLAPGEPGSLELIRGLYDELLPHFSSRQFNVGCDETVDLGQGRSKELVEKLGEGKVYFDFLMQIYRDVSRRGYTMQFWGDIIMLHPELAAQLPRDVLALEWGYEANHPFDEHGAIFAASGVPFYVCPGTSSWNSVAGRTDNSLENLRSAAENGRKHGACGYLITDWGDRGHWQPLAVSYLGFAYGSAVSWAYEANKTLDMPAALNTCIFRDTAGTVGNLIYDLGNIYKLADRTPHNSSLLFWLLQLPPAEVAGYAASEEEATQFVAMLQNILPHAEAIIQALPQTKMEWREANLVVQELVWATKMLRHACHRGIWAMNVRWEVESAVFQTGKELAETADSLIAEFESLWLARNRPGGLHDSLVLLQKMRQQYNG